MNSKVIHLLNNLKEYSEKVVNTIEELRKVDWSAVDKQVTEEGIGKLCWFSDFDDFAVKRIGILKGINKRATYPYETEAVGLYKYCKRITEEELEDLT